MSYIKQLETDCCDYRNRLALAHRLLRMFEEYLQGPKFQGLCEDYIHTHEVHSLIRRVDDALAGVPEEDL